MTKYRSLLNNQIVEINDEIQKEQIGETMGFENIKVNLRSDKIVEGETVKITGEVENRQVELPTGQKIEKYVIPVKKNDGDVYSLWLFENDAKKIKSATGSSLEDYLGATLTLGLEKATDKAGKSKKTKNGAEITNIVIRSVSKRN